MFYSTHEKTKIVELTSKFKSPPEKPAKDTASWMPAIITGGKQLAEKASVARPESSQLIYLKVLCHFLNLSL